MSTFQELSPQFETHTKYRKISRRFHITTIGFTVAALIGGIAFSLIFAHTLPLFVAGAIVMGWAQIAGF